MNYRILNKDVFFKNGLLFLYEEKEQSQANNLHKHQFFEIFLTLSDHSRHNVNGTKLILPLHSLVFVRESDIHENLFPDVSQSYVQLLIDSSVIHSLFSYLGDNVYCRLLLNAELPPTIQLNTYDYNKVMKLFDRINLLNADDADEINFYCKKLLFKLFTEYFSNYSFSDNKKTPYWLEQAMELTKRNKVFIEGIDSMVELCGKSYKHLSRSMKKYLNMTPSEYINDLRLNYAANLCRNTRQPITDICYNCGFNNISYFYFLFKNKYGCTPLELRQHYIIE